MSVFVQKLNILTGNTEWVVEDECYDFHQEIARSQFADMLHDTDRNKKYYAALKIAIKQKHDAGEEARVLDIGTGTGLLSMMAAKLNADSIVACECFPPIAAVAREVIDLNGFKDRIKVVSKRSTELVVGEDLERKANILVTEVFDTELIGEGAIETFNHAHKHLLEEGAIVIPSLGRMYGAIVESSLLRNHNTPLGSTCPDLVIPKDILSCHGTPALHDIQVSQLPKSSFSLLTEPALIFSFEFHQGGLKMYEESVKELEVLKGGRGDSVVVWWELDMLLEEGCPVISCSPTWLSPDTPWRDHWMQAVYHLPPGLTISTQATLASYHDQFSLWFNLQTDSCEMDKKLSLAPVCECGFHVTTSRSRTAAMNDKGYWDKFMGYLKKLLKPSSIVFFIGDTSLIPLAAAKLCSKVYCVEESKAGYKVMKTIIDQNKLDKKVILYPSYDSMLLTEEVTHVISEPYLRSAIYPWEHLRIWYLSKQLVNENNVECLPDSGVIKVLPINFEHLFKIRSPLGSVEGFDMTPFDKLVQSSIDISDPDVEVHPLWEYPGNALSQPQEVMKFDLTQSIPANDMIASGSFEISCDEVCNGIALWMDWYYKGETVSSGGIKSPVVIGKPVDWEITSRQGVYLIRQPAKASLVNYNVTFDPHDASCLFNFFISS